MVDVKSNKITSIQLMIMMMMHDNSAFIVVLPSENLDFYGLSPFKSISSGSVLGAQYY